MTRILLALFAAAIMLFPGLSHAHEVRPAYLEVIESKQNEFTVTWKQPVVGEMAIPLVPHMSGGWLDGPPEKDYLTQAYRIRIWRVHSAPEALAGQTVRIDGLERSITDALVRVHLADGRSFDAILKPSQAHVTLFEHFNGLAVNAYFKLGFEHILAGIDHLAFVLGLLLLVGVRWSLVKAITAFTVAHCITLAASATGLIRIPSSTIEALVALSIVFVAYELTNARRGADTLTTRQPWIIAFTFGLLHGFAFAGALADVGLPKDAIVQSLLLFNLGVEAGQLLFVSVCVVTMLAVRPLGRILSPGWYRLGEALPVYAIGSFGAFWFLERTAVAFS